MTTRGDEVRRWATQAELTALLYPVDTLDEVRFLVARYYPQFKLKCDDINHTAVREVEDGYELFVQQAAIVAMAGEAAPAESSWARAAGLPSPQTVLAMLGALTRELWALAHEPARA